LATKLTLSASHAQATMYAMFGFITKPQPPKTLKKKEKFAVTIPVKAMIANRSLDLPTP